MEEQKLKITDLPALFVTFAVILILSSLGKSYSSTKDLAQEDDLIKITGTVKEFTTYIPKNGGRIMEISMVSDGSWYKVSQNDLTWKYPNLNSISSGDIVTTFVTDKCCASNLKSLWGVTLNGIPVLTFDNVSNYKKSNNSSIRVFSKYVSYVGILLALVGILLRYKYGKWSS